jgi:hypothetical protein
MRRTIISSDLGKLFSVGEVFKSSSALGGFFGDEGKGKLTAYLHLETAQQSSPEAVSDLTQGTLSKCKGRHTH